MDWLNEIAERLKAATQTGGPMTLGRVNAIAELHDHSPEDIARLIAAVRAASLALTKIWADPKITALHEAEVIARDASAQLQIGDFPTGGDG